MQCYNLEVAVAQELEQSSTNQKVVGSILTYQNIKILNAEFVGVGMLDREDLDVEKSTCMNMCM